MTSVDEQQPIKEETENIKCTSCGGNTEYNPETLGLKCPFCSHEMPIEPTYDQNVEIDFDTAGDNAKHLWTEDKRVFQCSNCGAESILDAQVVADFCSFCGSSHIAVTDHSAGIKPGLLVPFQLSEEQAREKFRQWIKGHFFAPTQLKKTYRLHKMSGAYLPYWTYDSQTQSSYTVNVGNYYYETVTRTVYEDGKSKQVTEQVQKIRWHTERGNYKEFFDDILIKASSTVNSKLLAKVEPFNLTSLTDYKLEYMSGFLAERYTVSLKDGYTQAQAVMKARITSGIERSVAGDIVQVTKLATDYTDITYKHVLLPIWISSFHFKEKIYQFIVNGQTGKVAGHYPISAMKVIFFTLGVLVVLFIIYLFIEG